MNMKREKNLSLLEYKTLEQILIDKKVEYEIKFRHGEMHEDIYKESIESIESIEKHLEADYEMYLQ